MNGKVNQLVADAPAKAHPETELEMNNSLHPFSQLGVRGRIWEHPWTICRMADSVSDSRLVLMPHQRLHRALSILECGRSKHF